MDVASLPEFDGHELVLFAQDAKSGLRAVVAIHSTLRGPATGGTRYAVYASERDAVRDALRLSRAMTYKCALAGVPYGGGKGVILRDNRKPKSAAYLSSYARAVNSLGGNFTTGEDVGLDMRDIRILHRRSRFVNGVRGDLGPWAARGVFEAMRAALRAVYGSDSFSGRTVAVKGLGKVGGELCRLVADAGAARIIGADVNALACREARRRVPGIELVSPVSIHRSRADVFAPCALSGDLTARTIGSLHCAIVCGGANNQLGTPDDGARLHRAGILYVPDYLANAGGLIQIAGEMLPGGYRKTWVVNKIAHIRHTAKRVIDASKRGRKPTSVVADELARSLTTRRIAA